MAAITSHVLDITKGLPARGIRIRLEREGTMLAEGVTGESGRIDDTFFRKEILEPGIYTLNFAVGQYFASQSEKCFFPEIVIHFAIENGNQNYHIPVLLSLYGYSTYRGS